LRFLQHETWAEILMLGSFRKKMEGVVETAIHAHADEKNHAYLHKSRLIDSKPMAALVGRGFSLNWDFS
jgi:hypothetical protein